MPENLPATTQATTKYYCGVSFEIGEKTISLDPSTAINDIKYKGLECALPGRVPLGDVSALFDSVLDSLGVDYSYDKLTGATKGIPVLEGATKLLGDAGLAIEEFHLKIPAGYKQVDPNDSSKDIALTDTTTPPKDTTRFTAAMSMIWDTTGAESKTGEKEGHLFGNIYLKGLYFKVSNENRAPALPGA